MHMIYLPVFILLIRPFRINFSLRPCSYVHRSGRTARATHEGLAVALVSPEDTSAYRRIIHSLNGGQDLPAFPVDGQVLSALNERLTLALEIDKVERSNRKVSRYRVEALHCAMPCHS